MEKNKIIFTTQNVHHIILCNNLREQIMKCAIDKTNNTDDTDDTNNNRICSKIKQEYIEYKCNHHHIYSFGGK